MLNYVRSIGFYTSATILTLLCIIPFPIVILNKNLCIRYCQGCLFSLTYLARIFCGIKWKIEGEENIPKEPFILASKHLSAWETFFFAFYFKIPVYIFKRELARIPIFGWYMTITGMIAIKRGGGSKTIKEMTRRSTDVIKNQKRVLIIFPQGTRTPVDADINKYPYKRGLTNICAELPYTPVLTATHDAVKFFGRNFLSIKKPGTITVKFMPAIKKMENECSVFLNQIKNVIEMETKKLF